MIRCVCLGMLACMLLSFAAAAVADDIAYIASLEQYYVPEFPMPGNDPYWGSVHLELTYLTTGYSVQYDPDFDSVWLTGPVPSIYYGPNLLAEFVPPFSPESDHWQGPIRFDWGVHPAARIQVWQATGYDYPNWTENLIWTSPTGVAQGHFEAVQGAERWRIAVVAVPEPCSVLVMLCGVAGLVVRRKPQD